MNHYSANANINFTVDLDLMKGNPTLHLRKSDSSNSQAMPSSSCKKIKKKTMRLQIWGEKEDC